LQNFQTSATLILIQSFILMRLLIALSP
jgi:hypothetical protein